MRKSFVVALAVNGSLVVGPAALAAPAESSRALPGFYTPQHSGHDHGKKGEHKHEKHKKSKHDHDHGHHHDHDHGHHHHHNDDSAHASGGYDSHRHHPRNW